MRKTGKKLPAPAIPPANQPYRQSAANVNTPRVATDRAKRGYIMRGARKQLGIKKG